MCFEASRDEPLLATRGSWRQPGNKPLIFLTNDYSIKRTTEIIRLTKRVTARDSKESARRTHPDTTSRSTTYGSQPRRSSASAWFEIMMQWAPRKNYKFRYKYSVRRIYRIAKH